MLSATIHRRNLCEITMSKTYAATGTLDDGWVVRLDKPLPLSSGKVKLIVESIEPTPAMTPEAFETMLRDRQRARLLAAQRTAGRGSAGLQQEGAIRRRHRRLCAGLLACRAELHAQLRPEMGGKHALV